MYDSKRFRLLTNRSNDVNRINRFNKSTAVRILLTIYVFTRRVNHLKNRNFVKLLYVLMAVKMHFEIQKLNNRCEKLATLQTNM